MEKPLHAPGEGTPKHSTQMISLFVGGLLFLIGISGLMLPEFAGLHLSVLYSFIVIISGLLLFYSGYVNNSRVAFISCLIFFIFFGIHALVGWLFGQPGTPNVGHEIHDSKWIAIIPNFYELGRNDHILNTILSVVLAGGALDWWIRHKGEGSRREVLKGLSKEYLQLKSHHKKVPQH